MIILSCHAIMPSWFVDKRTHKAIVDIPHYWTRTNDEYSSPPPPAVAPEFDPEVVAMAQETELWRDALPMHQAISSNPFIGSFVGFLLPDFMLLYAFIRAMMRGGWCMWWKRNELWGRSRGKKMDEGHVHKGRVEYAEAASGSSTVQE